MLKNTRKGVSLVAVLLFMLVATIAGTATYKWLSSAGRSSSSRMLMNEAQQAAYAGIASARAWMTYHGNETGAAIRQYLLDESTPRAPLKLTKVLKSVANSNNNQKFDVYIVDVNTNSLPYTIKLVSVGEARNGAKYSEVAVLKISGLYQVKIPEKSSSVGFNDAFHGSLATAGNLVVNSATVNGNPKPTNAGGNAFSNVEVEGDLIITGKAEFNSNTKVGNLYVIGDFIRCSNVKVTGSAYVGGKWYGGMGASGDSIFGDLYVGGGLDLRTKGPAEIGGCSGQTGAPLYVEGNLTLGAVSYMPINNAQTSVLVKKNLVEDDKFVFDVNGNDNQWGFQFNVLGNTYLKNGIEGSHLFKDVERVVFGNSSSTSLYSPNLYRLSDKYPGENVGGYYCASDDCDKNSGVGAFFKVNGTYYSGTPSSADESKWRAGTLPEIASKIASGGKEKGCETDLYVKDPLQFNQDILNVSQKLTSSKKGSCSASTVWNPWPSDWVGQVNSCYSSERSANNLYKDKWLVMEFSTSPQWSGSSSLLDGNFIFIIEGANPPNQLDLPDMTENSNVFIYFPNGWNHTLTLSGSGGKKNYFIYSDGNIKDFQMNKDRPLTGSVFMANCSRLNTVTSNSAVYATANSSLTQALAEISVICENDETDKCGGVGGGSGSGSSSGSDGANDSYYIAVAPQLYIQTESQYKNDELTLKMLDNSAAELTPSILILPRVLYLPANPDGSLADYYDVINLNGATATKNPNAVTCSPASMPTNGSFSSYGDLNPGIYKCNYAGNTYGAIPFYIVVSGELGETPKIQFVDRNIEINKTEIKTVKVKVDPAAGAKPISVDVYQSPLPENWSVSGQTAYVTNADGSKVYTVTVTPHATEEKEFTLFTVEMPQNGVSSSVTFQMIDPCDGCIIGKNYDHTTVVASGSFDVHIKNINAYCALAENADNADCLEGGSLYKVMQAESCEDMVDNSAWVRVNGIGCSPDKQNEKWNCSVFIDPNVQLLPLRSSAHTTCEVTVAPKEIYSAKVDVADTLYASITRRSYPLHVKITGAESNSKVKVTYAKTGDATTGDLELGECEGNLCTYTAYHGYKYFFTYEKAGSDKFAAWKCEGNSCTTTGSYNPYVMSVSSENTVTARFNEEDVHCLYEDFDDDEDGISFPTHFCDGGANKRCIDTCDYRGLGIGNSCSIENSIHKTSKPEWVMVYDNRPLSVSGKAQRTVKRDFAECVEKSVFSYKYYEPSGCEKKIYEGAAKDYSKSVLFPNVSGGYIAAASDADVYANDDNGTQSVILSTKQAGTNGTLTSLFTTNILGVKLDFPSLTDFEGWKKFVAGDVHSSRYDMENSGFIFRSNADASKYFSLSIYGLDNVGGNYSNKVYARLCLVTGQTATIGSNICKTEEMSVDAWETTGSTLTDITQQLSQGLGFTTSTKFNLSLKISGNLVNVEVTLDRIAVKDGQKNIQFNLSDFGETLEGNEYVGLKLSNPEFKVYDVSWQSDTYASDCWATPRIICSFRSNYAGGIVPLDENAKPWVVLSSFEATDYEKYGCSVKYYYNGCDNTTTGTIWTDYSKDNLWGNLFSKNSCQNNADNLGLYWDDGAVVSGGTYNFSREGRHGYAHASGSGTVKDAKVKLNCQSASATPPSSLTASQSCGQFIVGDIEVCEKNFDFMKGYSSAIQCIAGSTCTVELDAETYGRETANLRDASLYYKLNSPECNGAVYVSMIDSLGNKSENVKISSNGDSNFDVDEYSDADGFDPQTVKKIQFSSTECDFDIQHVESECPYALGIKSCSASYNGSSWLITAEILNAEKCEVVPPYNSNPDMSEVKDDCAATFKIHEPGLFKKENDETYTFTLKASNGEESVEKQCSPYELKTIGIDCSVSPNLVEQGGGFPTLTYSFDNCPPSGCNYKISFDEYVVSGLYTGLSGNQSFSELNTVGNKMKPGTYNFVIDVQGKKKEDCSFTVVAPDDNQTATASNCHFNAGTKVFTADVSYTGNNWSASFGVTDGTGHVLGTVGAIDESTDNSISYDLSHVKYTTGRNVIVLTMNNGNNGSLGCAEDYQIDPPSSSSVAQSVSSSSALVAGTSSSVASGNTICMVETEPDYRNQNQYHPKVYSIGPGTYTLKHSCGATKTWYMYCTAGMSITLDGNTYQCKGESESIVTNYNSMPRSETSFTVPTGMTIKSFSCIIYNTAITPPAPSGCTENGVFDVSSSSAVVSSSSEVVKQYKADCSFNTEKVYAQRQCYSGNVTFTANNFSVKDTVYKLKLYDEANSEIGSFDVTNCNQYYCQPQSVTFCAQEIGKHKYTLKSSEGAVVCSKELEVAAPSASSCSLSPKTAVETNQDYTFTAMLDVSSMNVAYEVYVDGTLAQQGDYYVQGDGKLVYKQYYQYYGNGSHKFELYSMGQKLCEDALSVGDYPSCEVYKTGGDLSSDYDQAWVYIKNVKNCGSGCSYVVSGGGVNLTGTKNRISGGDLHLVTIYGSQVNKGSNEMTVTLTNSLGSGSCKFSLNRW